MNQLFEDIKARIALKCPHVLSTLIYNNQFERMNRDKDNEAYVLALPAVLVEFVEPDPKSTGGGRQIYDPLTIRIHIGMEELDAADGTMDSALSIYALKNEVYLALQGFQATTSSTFDRQHEQPDYDHDNMYVWLMDFAATFIDDGGKLPRNSIIKTAPTPLEVDASIVHNETNLNS